LALFTVGSLAAAVSTSQVHAQEQGFLQDVALESIYRITVNKLLDSTMVGCGDRA
jgi:hypothetical protein